MKKVFMTILVMLLSLMASAEDVNINGINYYLYSSNNTAQVRDGNYSGNVTIPSSVTYNGITYTVTEIGFQSFKDCNHMTSISIPNSVTIIDSYAFQYCAKLTSITLPSSVKTIGSQAFDGCIQLNKVIVLSETLPTMSSNSFTNYNITLKVPEAVLSSYQTTWPWNQFSDIQPMYTKRTINVAVAGTLPNLIPEDEKYLITDLTLTGELNGTDFLFLREMAGKTIAGGAYGRYLKTNGILSVLNMSSINIVAGGESYYLDMESYEGDSEYYYLLNNNTLPAYVFENCKSLTSITFPYNLKSINYYAFSGCTGLTSVNIPNSVTSIGWGAFQGCNELSSLFISNSVTSIGANAFYGCEDLVRIVSRNKIPPTCENGAFSSKAYCMVWVPKGCKEAYLNANEWKDFKEIREIDGDINLDGKVNKSDIDALVTYIMKGNPAIYRTIADLNDDENVNAADVVTLINLLNKGGLNTEFQLYFDNVGGNSVVTSITCTLNNERNEAIQLTKCKLYCNESQVGFMSYSGGSTVAAGGSKTCSFTGLSKPANSSNFSVVWYYTYNGESYTYRCDLTE